MNTSNQINNIYNATSVIIVAQACDKGCRFITKMYILLILILEYDICRNTEKPLVDCQ